MKRLLFTVFAFVIGLSCIGAVAADTVLFQQDFDRSISLPPSFGSWMAMGGRLHQVNTSEHLAKINLMVPQSGEMQYEFNVKYEDGGFEDRMGGFGLHIFVDRAHTGKSWGNGNSFLLWLNYDEKPTYGSKGFQAQVYKSTSPTKMVLVSEFDLNPFVSVLNAANMAVKVNARIKINGSTGAVWVEDPTLPGYGYSLSLGRRLGSGSYVAFRTNSLALSFDELEISKLD